ncbi:diguanylate cyclase [Azospirillum sp. sgz301742]
MSAAGTVGRGVRWADRPALLLCANALVAAGYFAFGVLTDLFFRKYGFFPAPLWPAASLSVAAAMALGGRAWPGIFLGSLAANHAVFDASLIEALGVSAGNALGPVAGVLLARRLSGPLTPRLGLRPVAAFTLGAIGVHAVLTAAGGTAVLFAAGAVSRDDVLPAFVHWWLSDAGGTLVLAPTVLLWMLDRGIGAPRRGRLVELALVSAATLAGGAALFTGVRFDDQSNATLPFLLLVPLAWMAMRFLLRDAYTLFSVLVLLMVGGTAMGYGPFAAPGIEKPMLFVGVFIVTAALTVLSCGAQANDRRRAEHSLRRMVDTLEQAVADRTAELREREEQLRIVLEDAPIPLFVTSLRTHRLTFVNSLAERLLGSTRERLIGAYAPKYWADPAERERLLEAIARDGHARSVEVGFLRQGGEAFVALLSAARTMFDGEPAFIVGINDITDRKRTENAVRESERKLRILADNMTDVVWSVDADLHYTYISPSIERLRGFKVEEMMGRHIQDGLTPESFVFAYRHILEACGAAARGEASGPAALRMELEHAHKDGSRTQSEVCATVLFDAGGGFIGLQGVTRDITERKRLEAELQRLAIMDGLTELPNRRHFLKRLEAEIERARRYDRPLCVAMIDLDHFKTINDTHGHAAGDEVLRRFAAIGRDALRASDVIGRLGGEEFAIALPEAGIDAATPVMERLREAVGGPWVHDTESAFSVTISVGIAELRPEDDVTKLLSRADRALYAAKRQGRNRVVPEGLVVETAA